MANYDGNLKMKLHLEDFIQQQIYFLDYYDKPGILFLKKYLHTDDVFVDVGANVGAFTLMAANKVGNNGKIIAFEPVSKVYEQLKYNIQLNNLHQVKIEKKALYNETTELNFVISANSNLGMSSIFEHDEKNGQTEIVQAIKGDEYFSNNPIPKMDLIKMDIEGAEYFALQGLKETLKKYKPIILIEISEPILHNNHLKKEQLISFFEELQYVMNGIDYNGNMVSLTNKNLNDSDNYAFINKGNKAHNKLFSLIAD